MSDHSGRLGGGKDTMLRRWPKVLTAVFEVLSAACYSTPGADTDPNSTWRAEQATHLVELHTVNHRGRSTWRYGRGRAARCRPLRLDRKRANRRVECLLRFFSRRRQRVAESRPRCHQTA